MDVFVQVTQNQSFAKAADQMGMSPAYISKRIKILEQTLGCALFHRNSRTLKLTEKGKIVYCWGSRILAEMEEINEALSAQSSDPSGALSITSSVGFGHNHVAPVLSEFARAYPKIKLRFDTIDAIPDMLEQQVDLDVRIGNHISPNLIAKKIYANRRILCASPEYLARYGTPQSLFDLLQHQCLVIKERDHPFGVWRLDSAEGRRDVKVSGGLASNNGEIVCLWAKQGHGIMLRSGWDVGRDIAAGRLVQVLPDYWQDADIWAVYPNRLNHSAKLRVCVDFLEKKLTERLAGKGV
nr:LysR family transcriptional regulator [Neisseria sp. HSC-16F19]